MPTLAGAQNLNIPKGVFTDVARDQFIFNLNQSHSPLGPLFSVSNVISSMAAHAKASQEQIKALAASIEALLKMLETEYHAGRLLETQSSVALESLQRYRRHCNSVEMLLIAVRTAYWERYLSLSRSRRQINSWNHYWRKRNAMYRSNPIIIKSKHMLPRSRYALLARLAYHVWSYIFDAQISALLNIQDWLSRNDKAREEDQKTLYALLNDLQSNQSRLEEMFGVYLWNLYSWMTPNMFGGTRCTKGKPYGDDGFTSKENRRTTADGQRAQFYFA